ncbi:MAG: hypothetical protein EA370_17555 [Wenzhouxiangella sp.]|nr:MAG: hypothetical protein EA370_17555 [Wenzhouxiangella sp.]
MDAELHTDRQGLWGAFGALLASAGTLVCCVLPAVMVSIGAGAALAGLVSTVPQLIWLSERKLLVFGVAGLVLALAGWLLWRARYAPCPADPALAASCMRVRRWSHRLYALAVVLTLAGAVFAFALG